jgi:hypothetical protein
MAPEAPQPVPAPRLWQRRLRKGVSEGAAEGGSGEGRQFDGRVGIEGREFQPHANKCDFFEKLQVHAGMPGTFHHGAKA